MGAAGSSEALVTVYHLHGITSWKTIIVRFGITLLLIFILILSQNLDTGMQEMILTGLYT
jgi:hypothetical protein